MDRRLFLRLAALGAALPLGVGAHHGWNTFDTTRPLYVEGTVRTSLWEKPHVELIVTVPADLRVPADLARRIALPDRSDAAELLRRVSTPLRKDRDWIVELPSPQRMEALKVAELRPGDRLAAIGYTFPNEKGSAVLRADILLLGDRALSMRRSGAPD